MNEKSKKVNIQYYAVLREERGLSSEAVATPAETVAQLYEELKCQHRFKLSTDVLRVAINNEFCDWQRSLKENDTVVFIPPVAGG